jgi:hypothetical protein
MLLQLYTKLNLELVHQHARQLKHVVYCQKKLLSAHLCSKEVPRDRGWGGGTRGGRSNKGKPPEGGAYLPPRCRCKSAAVARPQERRAVARPQEGCDRRRIGARHGRSGSAFFPSQVFSPLLKRRWAGPIRFLIFNFVNTKQFGLLIFLSS